MSIKRIVPGLILLFVAVSVGCSSSDSVVEPAYVVDGQWSVQYAETSNECGPVSTDPFTGQYLIQENAGSYDVTVAMPLGECEELTSTRSGNEIVVERTTQRVVGGCTYQFVDTTRFDFDSDNVVTGTKTQEYVPVAGDCGSLATEMCDSAYRLNGQRCTDCWPGCIY